MKTLKNLIDEAFDAQFATKIEPMVQKYMKRAVEDKDPNTQLWQQLAQEVAMAKQVKPQQQPQQAQQSNNPGAQAQVPTSN